MNYERINWENAPSTDTPLDADNLNKMDEALDTLNRELAKARSTVAELEETAALLSAQIAGIIRLDDGSTTGDAELINGRIGKDGTEYDTLGNAIRGQVGALQEHIVEVSDEEPEEYYNKIWIKGDDEEIEIPTMEDLEEVTNDLSESIESLDNKIGDLDNLETTEKSTIVGAINKVVASVPAVDDDLETAGDAADAKATGDALSELNERLNDVSLFEILDIDLLNEVGEVTINPNWVNYAVATTTGELSSVTLKRAATKNLIYIPEGAAFGITNNDSSIYYNPTIYCFDKNKQFLSSVTSGLASGTYYVRLLTSRKDNGDITTQEVANALTIKLTITTPKDEINKIKNDVGISDITFTPVSGKYINRSGEEKTSATFNRSNALAITKGTIIEFTATGYNTGVSMISLSNSSATEFQSKVICIDSTERKYTYVADADGYIVVSYDNRKPYSLIYKLPSSNLALNVRVKAIEDSGVVYLAEETNAYVISEDVLTTVGQSGCYVGNGGSVTESANFKISSPISLSAGETIKFNAKGYNTNVSVLAKVNSDSTYTPLVISTDSDEHTFTYLSQYNMNVVISSNNNVTPKYSIFGSDIGLIETEINNENFVAFATMGVLGDSLASGASNYPGGASDRPNYSWGKFIQRKHGIEVSLFSSGGATTRSWLAQPYGLAALNNANPLDCYVIGLGVNDAYSLGADYLGSISDIHVGEEAQNADTYYGNYSKIIAAIKTKSPRAKIICLTNPRGTNSPETSFNTAISDIVELYTNTYLIDLVSDSFYKSADFKDTWYGAHSTAVGYKLIANNIYENIAKLIHGNLSEFTDIQWIVENHD